MGKSTYQVIETDADLISAAIAQIRVYVAYVSEDNSTYIIDYGGLVEKVTPDFIRIAGSYYSRSNNYEFRYQVPNK